MPNTREDLVDLLGETVADCMPTECLYEVADHLIANGVTAQKWIPVTERLPEIGDTYLVVVKYKYDWEDDYTIDTDVAMFHPYDNPDAYIDNRWDTYIDWDEGQQYIHVTHWMPLPEPPKGE